MQRVTLILSTDEPIDTWDDLQAVLDDDDGLQSWAVEDVEA